MHHKLIRIFCKIHFYAIKLIIKVKKRKPLDLCVLIGFLIAIEINIKLQNINRLKMKRCRKWFKISIG